MKRWRATLSRLLGLELFIAGRLVGSRKRSYVSLVSTVSTWGLALGVASLILIFSITSGFEAIFREKLLGVYPHLVVIGRGGDLPDWAAVRQRLEGQPHLTSVSAATYDEMMASHKGRRGGSIVKGVEVARPDVSATVEPFVVEGDLASLRIEPDIARTGDTVTVPALPGGSTWVLVPGADGALRRLQFFDEAEEMPRLRLISFLGDDAVVSLAGFLNALELTLRPDELSAPFELPEGPTTLTLGEESVPLTLAAGNQVAVVWRDGRGALRAATCATPPPRPAAQPAQLCAVNTADSAVRITLPSQTLPLSAGESRTVTEQTIRRPTVFLGQELARKIEAEVGDEIRLVSPLFSVPGVSSRGRPGRTIAESFEVAGIIALGFYEYDSKLAVVDFATARRFLHQGDVARWVEVRVDDLFRGRERGIEVGRHLAAFSLLDVQSHFPGLVDKYTAAAATLPEPTSAVQALDNANRVLGAVKFSNMAGELSFGFADDHRVITWEEMNKSLFTSMKRQRIVLSLFFLIILVVAAFNVVSSQFMIVQEKASDIAILKAMGATRGQIRRVFLLQGMVVGLVGTAVGLALGLVIGLLLDRVGFPLDPKVYFVSKLPVRLRPGDVVLASSLSLIAIYVAVSLAARRASDKSPVEGLRELE